MAFSCEYYIGLKYLNIMSRHQVVTMPNAMFQVDDDENIYEDPPSGDDPRHVAGETNNYEDPIRVEDPRHVADEHVYEDAVAFKEPHVPEKKQTSAGCYTVMWKVARGLMIIALLANVACFVLWQINKPWQENVSILFLTILNEVVRTILSVFDTVYLCCSMNWL